MLDQATVSFNVNFLKERAKDLAQAQKYTIKGDLTPIKPQLNKAKKILEEAYRVLAIRAKRNEEISVASEWLIDNFYIIQEQIVQIANDLPLDYQRSIPVLTAGEHAGLPRVYELVLALVLSTDNRVEMENLTPFVQSYQEEDTLMLGEIWAIPIMARFVLIEQLAERVQRILKRKEIQKKVDELVQSIMEIDTREPGVVSHVLTEWLKDSGPLNQEMLVEMANQFQTAGLLKDEQKRWFIYRFNQLDLTVEEALRIQAQKESKLQVSIQNAVVSLRSVSETNWADFVESMSVVDQILRLDPSGNYPKMDFQTRDQYRRKVERMARFSDYPETEVAEQVLLMAEEHAGTGGSLYLDYLHDETALKKHVGYYLLGEGQDELRTFLGYKMPFRERMTKLFERKPGYYAGLIAVNTLVLMAILWLVAGFRFYPVWVSVVGMLVALFPAMDLSVALVNRFFAFFLPPRLLPKMKYSEGIPPRMRTVVVVPTMIHSEDDILRQIEQLEIHSLANSDSVLQLGLLTDFPDSDEKTNPGEEEMLQKAEAEIKRLNEKYPCRFGDKFFLMHRERHWNEKQQVWMGWERKRGKLEEFNQLVSDTDANTSFTRITGNILQTLKNSPIQFAITLDADTRLPPQSVNDMVRTAAHPLNRGWRDPKTNRITKGYAIIQPRISIPPDSVEKTLFTKIFSGNVGLNPYTTAVSDIYQDLTGEAVFLGKGIYDVKAFHEVMECRLPDNRILSHDLLESSYLRTGLATDIELFDEFPNTYFSYSKRNHRWTRGDWQIGRWIFGTVPGKTGKEKNPVNFLSAWKIADNLRRSLSPFFLTVFFITGWFWLPGSAWLWTLLAFGILAFPIYMSLSTDILNRPARVKWMLYFEKVRANLKINSAQAISTLIFLPHQAVVHLDAMIRSLWRLTISKKKLLEWTTAFQTEVKGNHKKTAYFKNMAFPVILGGAILVIWLYTGPLTYGIVIPFALLWIVSPYYAWYISQPIKEREKVFSKKEEQRLRMYARRTWFYFERFVTEENFWLPPDNYQEDPPMRPVNRTSPTNIGLGLISAQIAYNRGYISFGELLHRQENTLRSLEKLERYKGHFFNWYETTLGEVLNPRYISTVDSGNLAAGFIVVKEALKNVMNQPLNANLWSGLRDTLFTVRHLFGEKKNQGIVSDAVYNQVIVCTDKMLDQIEKGSQDGSLDLLKNLKNEAAKLSSADLMSLRHTLGDQEMEHLLFWVETPLNQIEKFIDEYRQLGGEKSNPVAGKSVPELEDYLKSDGRASAKQAIGRWKEQSDYIIETCQRLFDEMDFSFLYIEKRGLFTIGYNLDKAQFDNSTYDLLASEARIASYIAIAKGDVPAEHWFRLSRRLTSLKKNEILLSWSGTMFEYLMPLLFLKSYPNTLLSHTYKNVVEWQQNYASGRGYPWGFSESAYGFLNLELHYQYRAFGAPGLGLKRGLADEYVVAPYASMLSLMMDPKAAITNLENIEDIGGYGMVGFYDALDFTASRLKEKEGLRIVKTYMAHHHGMSLIALENVLNDDIIQDYFHSDPQIRSCNLLLQEQIPRGVPIKEPHPIDVELEPGEQQTIQMVVEHAPIEQLDSGPPRTHIMSNGGYSAFVTHSGTGGSMYHGKAMTAWKPDPTLDPLGFFFYIKDVETGKFWSAGHQPVKRKPDRYDTWFHNGKMVTSRVDEWIETTTEICVSPDHPMEFRKLILTNYSNRKRTIEVTSYAEAVLNQLKDHNSHPAFSKLFLQTEYLADHHSILVKRRPRGEHEQPEWLIHTYAGEEAENLKEPLQYETERSVFIGRGRDLENPKAMDNDFRLTGSLGNVSDPIVSLRKTITLKAGEKKVITFGLGWAQTLDDAYMLADLYDNIHATNRVFDLASVYSGVELEHVNITSRQAHYFQKLASFLFYPNSELRGDIYFLERNREQQHRLWAYGISGDLPLLVFRVNDVEQMKDVKTIIKAHEFWRVKGLRTELLILNDHPPSYADEVQEGIQKEIQAATGAGMENQGGIYLHRTGKMPEDDLTLILTVAYVVMNFELPDLTPKKTPLNHLSWSTGHNNQEEVVFKPARLAEPVAEPENSEPDPGLQMFNGMGGFNGEGNEYHIILKQDAETGAHQLPPAPWINVISNGDFGFLATETGGGYTWSENSRENKLTSWANDPVTDPPAEAFYVRDEEQKMYWSLVCSAASGPGTYKTVHGFGYTRYEYEYNEIMQKMVQFVPTHDPVKISKIILRNNGAKRKQLSLFRYQELVHGVERDASVRFIVPEKWDEEPVIYSRNYYNNEFAGRVGFCALVMPKKEKQLKVSYTADRLAFIGRNRSLKNPVAVTHSKKLNNLAKAGKDICAAFQATFTLEPGEEAELLFLTGETEHQSAAKEIIEKYSKPGQAGKDLNKVKQDWKRKLTGIQIETPDNSLNLMVNGWLMYQNISCRMWSRTAYYQAGGAYGFRDQLQDAAAAIYVNPDITREQMLLHASKQFPEGDVLHWWHPPTGRGIRSKITDDRLWLPYVLIHYLQVTDDDSVLTEKVPYIKARSLEPEEHEVYLTPEPSGKKGTLYEHCCKAIDITHQLGRHGLPLMGAGDWNDGMNGVGKHGEGESVWLGFFLYGVLKDFIPVCKKMNDDERAGQYQKMADDLKEKLNSEGWDGNWYLRAFYDDGTPLGSAENDECKIDAISQAWSVITGAAEEERIPKVLESVEEYLVSEEDKIIRLLTPAFDQTEKNPGYIKGYIPGVRENGGQYTHGALWVVKAFAESGRGNKAVRYLGLINPVNHALDREETSIYKVEPYAVAADVYGEPPLTGRGGWTWYTGSAGWMYRVALESVLGLKLMKNKIILNPSISSDWENFKLKIRQPDGKTVYRITVENPDGLEHGRLEGSIDGKPLEIKDGVTAIDTLQDGNLHKVNLKLYPA